MIMCVLISMFLLIIGIIGLVLKISISYANVEYVYAYLLNGHVEINEVIILGKWGFGGRFHFHYSAKDFPMITGNLSDVDDIYRRF